MGKQQEDGREQFENEIKSRGMSAMKRDGRYVESATRFAFDFWKASRSSIVVELEDKVMVEDEFDKGHNCAIDYCAERIRSIGLSIKGEE